MANLVMLLNLNINLRCQIEILGNRFSLLMSCSVKKWGDEMGYTIEKWKEICTFSHLEVAKFHEGKMNSLIGCYASI